MRFGGIAPCQFPTGKAPIFRDGVKHHGVLGSSQLQIKPDESFFFFFFCPHGEETIALPAAPPLWSPPSRLLCQTQPKVPFPEPLPHSLTVPCPRGPPPAFCLPLFQPLRGKAFCTHPVPGRKNQQKVHNLLCGFRAALSCSSACPCCPRATAAAPQGAPHPPSFPQRPQRCRQPPGDRRQGAGGPPRHRQTHRHTLTDTQTHRQTDRQRARG